MANTAINASTVADISNDVGNALDLINDLTDQFKTNVIGKIERSWYNKNVTKVMPDADKGMTGFSNGANESLASLGKALAGAANAWAEANGRPSYNTRNIASNPRTISGTYRESGDDGFEGMDTEEIQQAVDEGERIKDEYLKAINKLRKAGERDGFRGGSMQSNLNAVCNTLEQQATRQIDNILDNITTNTGTARRNVIAAKEMTESTFQIK